MQTLHSAPEFQRCHAMPKMLQNFKDASQFQRCLAISKMLHSKQELACLCQSLLLNPLLVFSWCFNKVRTREMQTSYCCPWATSQNSICHNNNGVPAFLLCSTPCVKTGTAESVQSATLRSQHNHLLRPQKHYHQSLVSIRYWLKQHWSKFIPVDCNSYGASPVRYKKTGWCWFFFLFQHSQIFQITVHAVFNLQHCILPGVYKAFI